MFLGDASSVLVKATQRALRQLERESGESSASEKKKGIIVSALLWSDIPVLVPLFHVRLGFFFHLFIFQKIIPSLLLSALFALFFYHHFSLSLS